MTDSTAQPDRRMLIRHSASTVRAPDMIGVIAAHRHQGKLELDFLLTGAMDEVVLPDLSESVREDGLWRHTCFEAFVTTEKGGPYCEFNFSPSGAWAAYRFTGYRDGMSPIEMKAPPRISVSNGPQFYRYSVEVALGPATGLQMDADLFVNIAAVIESADGALSYWALHHPDGPADFHHSDCFVWQLGVAEPL